MRLTPGDAVEVELLQARIDALLDQDWKGRDAEELARQLRQVRLQIRVATVAYQAKMRDLQDARRRAS
jgi:hypothetical protein